MGIVSKPAKGERVKVSFEATVTDTYGGFDHVNLTLDGQETGDHYCAPPSAVTRIIPDEPKVGTAVLIDGVTWFRINVTDGWFNVFPSGGFDKCGRKWEFVYKPGFKALTA